jgi:hypothetical protein
MTDIFISYRRTDASGHARALHRDLCLRFPQDRIFFDRESIESGEKFHERIRAAVTACQVLLALIGPDWLNAQGPDGKRRLDDPKDVVRGEIALALRLNKPVIPVLFDDVPMPKPKELRKSLKPLAKCDALNLCGKTYVYDVQLNELVRHLAKVPGMPGSIEALRCYDPLRLPNVRLHDVSAGTPYTSHSASGTAAFCSLHSVGFHPACRIYPSFPRPYLFRGSIQSMHPCSVLLQTPVTGFACGLRY